MSINIKIKEKPDLKKMEISELIDYMENDFNFKTSYSYEELKETAAHLREMAVQGNADAQYAYATFYPNVYDMWYDSEELKDWQKDLCESKWYKKAIFAYEQMNISDPEILLRIGTAYLNEFLGEDTNAKKGVLICKKLIDAKKIEEDKEEKFKIKSDRNYPFKACLELADYYDRIANDLSDEDLEEDEEDNFDDFYYDDQDDDYRSTADMYEDKAYYYMRKMECILEDEVTNTDPVTQCIQGVRIFHSAKYNQAAEWYRKSAEQGYPIAMCYYAECLVKGVGGVKKNYDEAEGWYIKAIESGLNYALLWLGDFYLENSKIYSNAVENALECYELAAECGVYDAYKKLYKCYSGETKYPFAYSIKSF